MGHHVGGTCRVLLFQVHAHGKHGVYAQRVIERGIGVAIFGCILVLFAPAVGEYGVAIRVLLALPIGDFIGIDELWRSLGDGRTNRFGLFGVVRRM